MKHIVKLCSAYHLYINISIDCRDYSHEVTSFLGGLKSVHTVLEQKLRDNKTFLAFTVSDWLFSSEVGITSQIHHPRSGNSEI
jgi:hypothetical protein